jgi:hypothetical protein
VAITSKWHYSNFKLRHYQTSYFSPWLVFPKNNQGVKHQPRHSNVVDSLSHLDISIYFITSSARAEIMQIAAVG